MRDHIDHRTVTEVLLVLWLFMPLATSYYTVGCKITAVKSGKKWELEFTHPEILIHLAEIDIMHCFDDFPPQKATRFFQPSISKHHLKVKSRCTL